MEQKMGVKIATEFRKVQAYISVCYSILDGGMSLLRSYIMTRVMVS